MAGPETHIFKDITRIIGVAALYFLLARIGQCLAVEPGNVTPIWPASGFAFFVALRRTRYGWVGLWLGNFPRKHVGISRLSTAGDALRTIVTGLAIGPGDVASSVWRSLAVSSLRTFWRAIRFHSGSLLFCCQSECCLSCQCFVRRPSSLHRTDHRLGRFFLHLAHVVPRGCGGDYHVCPCTVDVANRSWTLQEHTRIY